MGLQVGVLALQGAFTKHGEALRKLDVRAIEVRKPEQLDVCDGLIIPGGESTTIMSQVHSGDFHKKLDQFAREKPVFGTCAGLILMSTHVLKDPMQPFGWLDLTVERNAYGRQLESFRCDIELNLGSKQKKNVPALFIRAPKIRSYGESVAVLATLNDEPVFVQQGLFLGATFHPELTEDVTIHSYFIDLIKASRNK